jgi:hypothetical protein
LTAALAANAGRVLNGDRDADEIDVMDWLGGKKSARVNEEVTASGHATAAPPSSVMNSRRFMSAIGVCSPPYANAGHQMAVACAVGLPRAQGITEGTAGPLGTPELF